MLTKPKIETFLVEGMSVDVQLCLPHSFNLLHVFPDGKFRHSVTDHFGKT